MVYREPLNAADRDLPTQRIICLSHKPVSDDFLPTYVPPVRDVHSDYRC